MESSRQNDFSNDSRTCLLSRTAGIRESRRFFGLASRTFVPLSDEGTHEDDSLIDLDIFLNQTWNIWALSVLFGFRTNDEVELKQYGKKLREEVATMLSQEDVSYKAKFEILELKRPKTTDHPTVKIEVHAQVVGQDDKEKCVYKGFLISWRTDILDTIVEDSVRLPLLLCRGTPNTMRAVHATLGRMFDCHFVSLRATQDDLVWLLPIFLSPGGGQENARKDDLALLEYVVPGLPTSDTITVEFQISALWELWKGFLGQEDKIDAEEVEKFYNVLQHQIMAMSNLQLGLCLLHRLHLPSITISESKMKVMNVASMNTILTYLNEKALDALHINLTQLSI